ncbi:MAG: FAD-dependent oxidoreductase [Betaproteobacteria bacterium]|nr:FAD-dependent oxidoreductase [Betaproteobacteria bacterium]MDH5220223.1 FAD-dependent oxidoreductase [Betaproteobacteria bacterium]MDH5349888.1 FAD-dependent oxidoreductase [Betaproteobacteria bacterium]
MRSDSTRDVIVLGAGAGGFAAACSAAARGLRVLLLEKTPWVGGTAAISGGMVWIPANTKMAGAGLTDSEAAARAYLGATLSAGARPALVEAFLREGPAAIDWLEARTALRLKPVVRYPDYYPSLPGATPGGRVLEPVGYDARALGADLALLRPPLPEFTLFGGMMVDRADLPHLRAVTRSPRSMARVARLLVRHARERLAAPRGTSLVLGNALVARLLRSARDLGVEIRTRAEVARLQRDERGVSGVELRDGARIAARRGVVLAAGGFSHDAQRRARWLPQGADPASPVCEGDAGDGLRLGESAGGRVAEGNLHNAYWAPMSKFRRADGSAAVFPHTVADRGKPGIIAVNARGERFTSEAVSYHEFALAMFRAGAIPAFLLCDRRSLWQYGLGAVRPFTLRPGRFLSQGYLASGRALADLAGSLGVEREGLERTVAQYNADAVRGVDTRFNLGGDVYQRYLGDAAHGPNPCMRPIEQPPFYAVRLHPSDLGTAAGLVTDADARVLDRDGRPIAGLYACGNDMNSIMGGAYPGPGITLGPALVFGWLAARSLAGSAA